MKQPNIFNYATSELSQDAFISWLIQWADTKFKTVNECLYSTGILLLKSMLDKKGILLSEIEDLQIWQQHHKIDVFVNFKMNNQKVAIIIEDKTYSNAHSKQLERYLNKIKAEGYDVIVPIYFKTGFQPDFYEEINNHYYPYTIKDLKEVLHKGKDLGVHNDIFNCYFEFIKENEIEYDNCKFGFENYMKIPVSDWGWWNWNGFFKSNHKNFGAGTGIIPNPRGSLLGFWFGGVNTTVEIDNKEFIYSPYLDVIFGMGNFSINYRLGLKGSPISKNIRNGIIIKLTAVLDEAKIEYKIPVYKKGMQTIRLLEILEDGKGMDNESLIKLLRKLEGKLKIYK